MRLRIFGGVALGLLAFAPSAFAQIAPDVPVSWGGYTWIRDRYEPQEFTPIGTFQGRNDVIKILLGPDGFDAPGGRDPGFSGGFYDTQGRKVLLNLPAGNAFATADLYIPGSWQAQQATKWQVTGLWGSVATPSLGIVGFPIIAFANSAGVYGNAYGSAGALGGRIMVYDDDADSWNILSNAINYNGWNTLRFEIKSDRYEFYLNGKLVFTDFNITKDPTAYLKEMFLNSKNNNTEEYAAFYANVIAGLLKNPADFEIVGSIPGMTEFYHFNSLGDFVSQRGISADQHFSLQNYTWAYGGGFTGQFDQTNSSGFDGTAYFGRFGIDVIQPMESIRIGFTSSAGRAMNDSRFNSASADADIYSAGGYVAYVTPQLYATVLSEYSWGRWDIAVPGQTQTNLNSHTYVVSGETGTTMRLSKTLNLVPNAQLVYLNSHYDGVSFGNVDVGFQTDDSVIGRAGARLQYDAAQMLKGASLYFGVSAVRDLAGSTSTVFQSPAFPGGLPSIVSGGFQDTAAQFASGFEVKLAGDSMRLYGDANYIVSGDTSAFRGLGGVTVKW